MYIIDFFFFNDTATTEIYPLSLHDALPILRSGRLPGGESAGGAADTRPNRAEPAAANTRTDPDAQANRSEEHTSELQSRQYLVCRLLLEKKKTKLHSLRHCVTIDH